MIFEPPQFVAGDVLTAEAMQSLSNLVDLLARSGGPETALSSLGFLQSTPQSESFLAIVTGNNGGTPPAHSWIHVQENGPGSFIEKPDGMTGDQASLPLYEVNGLTVPTNTIVRIWRGLGEYYNCFYESSTTISGGGSGIIVKVTSTSSTTVSLSGGGTITAYAAKVQTLVAGVWTDGATVWFAGLNNGEVPNYADRYLVTQIATDISSVPVYATEDRESIVMVTSATPQTVTTLGGGDLLTCYPCDVVVYFNGVWNTYGTGWLVVLNQRPAANGDLYFARRIAYTTDSPAKPIFGTQAPTLILTDNLGNVVDGDCYEIKADPNGLQTWTHLGPGIDQLVIHTGTPPGTQPGSPPPVPPAPWPPPTYLSWLATWNEAAPTNLAYPTLAIEANNDQGSNAFGRIFFKTTGSAGLSELNWQGIRVETGSGSPTFFGPEPDLQFVDGGGVTWSAANDTVNKVVQISANVASNLVVKDVTPTTTTITGVGTIEVDYTGQVLTLTNDAGAAKISGTVKTYENGVSTAGTVTLTGTATANLGSVSINVPNNCFAIAIFSCNVLQQQSGHDAGFQTKFTVNGTVQNEGIRQIAVHPAVTVNVAGTPTALPTQTVAANAKIILTAGANTVNCVGQSWQNATSDTLLTVLYYTLDVIVTGS